MNRLTFDGNFCDISRCQEVPCKYPHVGCSQKQVWERLKAIEDILGDSYDLDRLRELVEDDREGRCVALPCKVGDSVWILEPDENGDPCEVSGYICIGGNRLFAFLSPIINDEEEPMEICSYRYDDYFEDGFLGDIIVWPWDDCYFTLEEAKTAIGGGQE